MSTLWHQCAGDISEALGALDKAGSSEVFDFGRPTS